MGSSIFLIPRLPIKPHESYEGSWEGSDNLFRVAPAHRPALATSRRTGLQLNVWWASVEVMGGDKKICKFLMEKNFSESSGKIRIIDMRRRRKQVQNVLETLTKMAGILSRHFF